MIINGFGGGTEGGQATAVLLDSATYSLTLSRGTTNNYQDAKAI